MKSQQSGFTLIELIIVIVILGILAAFALPRFADMSGDARRATIEGATGSMRSASAIAHSAFLTAGTGADVAVTLEGVSVAMVNGYPTEAGIVIAAQISADDFVITPAPAAGSVTVSPNGAATATCIVTYAEAATAAGAPTITSNPTDC